MQAHDQAPFQLFVRDPINGIKVELNFAAEEAKRAGCRPNPHGRRRRQGGPRRNRLSRRLTVRDQATAGLAPTRQVEGSCRIARGV